MRRASLRARRNDRQRAEPGKNGVKACGDVRVRERGLDLVELRAALLHLVREGKGQVLGHLGRHLRFDLLRDLEPDLLADVVTVRERTRARCQRRGSGCGCR